MLKIEGVKKSYGDFRLDVSMEVGESRVTGLIGRNGSGKTTIFKAILDLIHLEEGRVSVFGEEVRNLGGREKNKMGVVLAESGFSGYLTVRQVEKILAGLYENFDERRFFQLSKELEVPWDKRIMDFSTGMRAKAKLVVALSHRPKLILLDEPTAGLDVVARQQVLDILRSYLEEDLEASVLISSHISSDLEGFCDDFYLIDQGKIYMHEETHVLLANYGVIKLSEEDYQELDRQYILRESKEVYGYKLLTDQRQFYRENYPRLVIEKANIDNLIGVMEGGK